MIEVVGEGCAGGVPPSCNSDVEFDRSSSPIVLPCGLPPQLIYVEKELSFVPVGETEVRTVQVVIELLSNLSPEELDRLVSLEQASWRQIGVPMSRAEILDRIQPADLTGHLPNPVLIHRVDREITGMIFLSFWSPGADYSILPRAYVDLPRWHDPTGDTIFAYSVTRDLSNPNLAKLGFFKSMINATLTLAQQIGIGRVVAFSRAEPLLNHIKWNPRFDEYQDLVSGRINVGRVIDTFVENFPKPTLPDFAKFFGFSLSQASLSDLYLKLISERPGLGQVVSMAQFQRYLALSDLESCSPGQEDQVIERYFRQHLEIGDPFQDNGHRKLGARPVRAVYGTRNDPRCLNSNLLMEYPAFQERID